jgi:hypothetical protein
MEKNLAEMDAASKLHKRLGSEFNYALKLAYVQRKHRDQEIGEAPAARESEMRAGSISETRAFHETAHTARSTY